jgi:hypothetical protein
MRDETKGAGRLKGITRMCLDCGQAWTLSPAERESFRRRGLQDPKRCLTCRRLRHAEREREQLSDSRRVGPEF